MKTRHHFYSIRIIHNALCSSEKAPFFSYREACKFAKLQGKGWKVIKHAMPAK
jgi:hypothetical protein